MFGDIGTASRSNECDGGRDVIAAAAIAARAACVQHMGRHFYLQRIGAHDADTGGDFVHRLAAHAQSGQKAPICEGVARRSK